VVFADPFLLKLIMARARVDSESFEFTVTTRMRPHLDGGSGGSFFRTLSTKVDTMVGNNLLFCTHVVLVWLESAVMTNWMRFERHVRMALLTWVGSWAVTESTGVSILHAGLI
jgi:hypothetical protein